MPANLGHECHRTYGREAFGRTTAVAGDAVTIRSIRCRNHGPRARTELEVYRGGSLSGRTTGVGNKQCTTQDTRSLEELTVLATAEG